MRLLVVPAAAAMFAAAPAAAAVYFQQTLMPSGGYIAFNGGFGDSTAYPHSVLAKTFTVTLSGGTIDEISWTFDVEQQQLWFERFDLAAPLLQNGNEYDTPTYCDVTSGDSCTTADGTVALSGGVGQVTQNATATGFNTCAALRPVLEAQNFVGISQNCAETYRITHLFDVSAHSAGPGPVTLTISGPAVPEPATWALLVTGFGLAGAAMRRRSPAAA